MQNKTAIAVALAAACAMPLCSHASDAKELAEIRDQIKQMKAHYETRIQSLEKRLAAAEAQAQQSATKTATAPAPSSATARFGAGGSGSGFNPSISLVLGGTYAKLSKNPEDYRIQGFMTGGEVGPGTRSFSLGESELTIGANIDHIFSGQATFALTPDNSASVEEAFVQANGLIDGTNLKFGRFLSSVGYLNSHHKHAWDFVDAPLAYQAFFGGQYRQDGLQAKWVAPTDTFIELGAEIGNGASFPGTDRNKNGANSFALTARIGGDIGGASSWRTGLSYLRTRASERTFTEAAENDSAFSGRSRSWIADAVYKWAPDGNAGNTSFKLQGEYFRRTENGTLSQSGDSGRYESTQKGWYLQGVYQFARNWRTGLRYDRLSSGTPFIELGVDRFASLSPYSPHRTSLMFDYSPSEFSRIRLQLAQDKTRAGVTDNEIFLQYIMNLGAHGAHNY